MTIDIKAILEDCDAFDAECNEAGCTEQHAKDSELPERCRAGMINADRRTLALRVMELDDELNHIRELLNYWWNRAKDTEET